MTILIKTNDIMTVEQIRSFYQMEDKDWLGTKVETHDGDWVWDKENENFRFHRSIPDQDVVAIIEAAHRVCKAMTEDDMQMMANMYTEWSNDRKIEWVGAMIDLGQAVQDYESSEDIG